MACLASSPGRISRTDVWISREEMVDFLEYCASSIHHVSISITYERRFNSLDASVAIRSKISLTKELRMAMALFEIPVSGCTCLSTTQPKNSSISRVWTNNNQVTYPCRYTRHTSPCGSSCVSSCRHPIRSSSPSLQTYRQWSSRAPWTQAEPWRPWRQEPYQQSTRANKQNSMKHHRDLSEATAHLGGHCCYLKLAIRVLGTLQSPKLSSERDISSRRACMGDTYSMRCV